MQQRPTQAEMKAVSAVPMAPGRVIDKMPDTTPLIMAITLIAMINASKQKQKRPSQAFFVKNLLQD